MGGMCARPAALTAIISALDTTKDLVTGRDDWYPIHRYKTLGIACKCQRFCIRAWRPPGTCHPSGELVGGLKYVYSPAYTDAPKPDRPRQQAPLRLNSTRRFLPAPLDQAILHPEVAGACSVLMNRGEERRPAPEVGFDRPPGPSIRVERKRDLHPTTSRAAHASPFLDAAVNDQPQLARRHRTLARMLRDR